MKIFVDRKIRNVSILLTTVHFLILISTLGPWSINPKEFGFWKALFTSITSTIVINVLFVVFSNKGKEQE